jgi:hypothetical protein
VLCNPVSCRFCNLMGGSRGVAILLARLCNGPVGVLGPVYRVHQYSQYGLAVDLNDRRDSGWPLASQLNQAGSWVQQPWERPSSWPPLAPGLFLWHRKFPRMRCDCGNGPPYLPCPAISGTRHKKNPPCIPGPLPHILDRYIYR